ncbi:MAG: DUF7948 domain-containing protein [Planctomycetota bacterium]|jgi:hypothetical protein
MRVVCIYLLLFLPLSIAGPAQAEQQAAEANAFACLNRLPLYFIENQGQVAGEVSYYIKGSDKDLYFFPGGVFFALKGDDAKKRWGVKLEFLGTSSQSPPKAAGRADARFNYFKGKQEDWKTGIPSWTRIKYENLWPGIDLVFSSRENRLKYEFIVEPGADPGLIRLAFSGASNIAITENGALEVSTPLGCFEDGVPYAYQRIDGEERRVSMQYALQAEKEAFGFEIGSFDPASPLILDPDMLVYCGYIGGDDSDYCYDFTVDDSGSCYVTGGTYSEESAFPVLIGPYLQTDDSQDCFVAKVKADGTGLDYCGYIGGDRLDRGYGIAVDDEGCAYITGETESDENTFPVIRGPDLTYNEFYPWLGYDGFVAKVKADGSGLVYCGYIGGTYGDRGRVIALDNAGRAVVGGNTSSNETSFPVKKGPDVKYNGGGDAFVARVEASGLALDYCGYIGGSDYEYIHGIALDGDDNAYVTGYTESTENGFPAFPVKGGPDLTHNGASDVFLAKVNAQGTDLDYCGYIGGSNEEVGYAAAVDGAGCAYVAGVTESTEDTFPVKVGPDLTFNGIDTADAFVAKVNDQGTELVYCGYIGGSDDEYAYGIIVDPEGQVYLGGTTYSDQNSFPVKGGPHLLQKGSADAYIAKVNAQGSDLIFCGFHGGTEYESGYNIAIDGAGHIYLGGSTHSDAPSFPLKVGPDLSYNGKSDAYVAKFNISLIADTESLPETGGTVNFALHAGESNASRHYLLLGSLSDTTPGFPLPGGMVTLPLNWDPFTDVVLLLVNTPLFADFLGVLDSAGDAEAQLNAPSLPPGFVGTSMYFAYCLSSPFDFVSIPMEIEIVP